jgi:hypothetical protein
MADVQGTRKRNYSATAIETTLVSSITSAATGDTTTSVAVVSVSGFPSAPFTVIIAPDTSKEEVVTVTAVVGTTLTIIRGQDNTQAVAHAAGASVRHGVSARDFKESITHMASRGYDTDSAILSNADLSHVHGIATGDGVVVGTTKPQTLTLKTLTTPTINGATITGAVTSSATITGGTITGATVTGLATPSGSSDASTKGYVDGLITTNSGYATAAAASAASAATSATSASNSANTAAASVATISGYATTASNSAAAAATSATSANNSALAAATSATSANNSALAAATSATSASNSITTITGMTGSGLVRDMGDIADADTTSTTYINIATVAAQAATSAASASTSATSAANSVATIASYATAASTSATSAATSASTAATSATSAAASALAASTSATSASASALAAATSATSASNSATTASNSAATATTQASNAATSASSALTSQTAAATSATSAAASATAASTSATSAAASATAAATSATFAATSATAAATSAASAAASVSSSVPLAGGTMTGALILNADPTAALGAVTKQYADAITAAINFHAPVKLATTANLATTYSNGTSGVGATLTATGNGRGSIDGVNITTGDRILVKNQTTDLQNGIYTVTNQGAGGAPYVLTRATDYDNSVEVANGDVIFCTAGTANAGVTFVNTSTNPVTIGTTSITFSTYTSASLPSQTGNAGYFLTTDGTVPSWVSLADWGTV